jgi:hypothetical protein
MENLLTQENLKSLVVPTQNFTRMFALECERALEKSDVLMETDTYSFEEDHPTKLRLYWLYKACLNSLVQERDIQIEQENIKGAISRQKIVYFLENEPRLSVDMRTTLIKIVKSNDVAGIRAVFEIICLLDI